MISKASPFLLATHQPTAVPRDHLRSRVDVFNTAIRVTNYDEDTATTRTIDPADLVDAFTARQRRVSPLLPENTLWWSHSSHGTAIAMWEPPRVRRVAMQLTPIDPPQRLNIPMPGMLFICLPGQPPWVFASPERPTQTSDYLYHAPTFNTYPSGKTCPGSNKYPLDPAHIPDSFWQSFFSPAGIESGRSRRHANDLWKLWQELDDQSQYPTDDLIPCLAVRDAMEIP